MRFTSFSWNSFFFFFFLYERSLVVQFSPKRREYLQSPQSNKKFTLKKKNVCQYLNGITVLKQLRSVASQVCFIPFRKQFSGLLKWKNTEFQGISSFHSLLLCFPMWKIDTLNFTLCIQHLEYFYFCNPTRHAFRKLLYLDACLLLKYASMYEAHILLVCDNSQQLLMMYFVFLMAVVLSQLAVQHYSGSGTRKGSKTVNFFTSSQLKIKAKVLRNFYE